MTLILITILFLLYCTYIGAFVCDLFKKQLDWVKLKFPVGLMTTFGVIQLVSFPLLYLHASMATMSIFFIVILVGLFVCATIYFVKNAKKTESYHLPKHIRKNLFLVGMVLGFVGLHLSLTLITNSLNVTSSDQSFYITLVQNNLDALRVNTLAPLTGIPQDLHVFYNFQSYFSFLTFISQLFSLDTVVVSVWFYPVLLLTFIATTILNTCSYFKVKNKWMIFSLFIIAFMFNFWPIESVVKYNMYNGYLRTYIFVFVFILYYEAFKNNKFNILLLNLVWFAGIAVQSTMLFNGYIFMAVLVLYDLFVAKRKVAFELFSSCIALHVYVFFFFRYSWHYKLSFVWALAVALVVILGQIKPIKQWVHSVVYHENMKKAIIYGYSAIILLMLIVVNYRYLEAPITSTYFIEHVNSYYFDISYYTSTVFSLVSTALKLILLAINIYLIVKVRTLNGALKFFTMIQIIMLIFFYNPLVAPFISRFITGSVYFRIRDILFIVPVFIASLVYIRDNMKNGKWVLIGITILATTLGMINIYEYVSYDYNDIQDFSAYNFYYRLPQGTVDVSKFLDEYVEEHYEDERPKVYSSNRQINYFSSRYEMVYSVNEERGVRNTDLDVYITNLDKFVLEALVISTERYEQYLYKYRLLLQKYDVDLVVLSNDVADAIKELTLEDYNRIYTNDLFTVYEVKNK